MTRRESRNDRKGKNRRTSIERWSHEALMDKSLGWLSGAPLSDSPDGAKWLVLKPRKQPQTITLDLETIRQAHFAFRVLKNESEKLKQCFRNPDEWLDRLSYLLQRLRRTEHRFKNLELSAFYGQRWQTKFDRAGREFPNLKPLLSSVAIHQLLCHDGGSQQFDWLAGHLPRFSAMMEANVDLKTQLKLCSMHRDMNDTWFEFVSASLAQNQCAASEYVDAVKRDHQLRADLAKKARMAEPKRPSEITEAPVRHALLGHIDTVYLFRSKRRRALFRILATTVTDGVFSQLRTRQAKLDATAKKIKTEIKHCHRLGVVDYAISRRANCVQEIIPADEANHIETAKALEALCSSLVVAESVEDYDSVQRIGEFFELLPKDWQFRANLLKRWLTMARPHNVGVLARLLRRFGSLIKQHGIPNALLENWTEYANNYSRSREIVGELLTHASDKSVSPDEMDAVFKLIQLTVFKGDLESDVNFDVLFSYARHAPSTEVAANVFLSLEQHDNPPTIIASDVQSAFAFTDSADTATQLLVVLDDHEVASLAKGLTRLPLSPALREHVARVLLGSNPKSDLKSLDELLSPLHELGYSLPAPRRHVCCDDWISNYPNVLWPSLRRINQASSRGREIAESMMMNVIPSKEHLKGQLAKLDRKLASRLPPRTRDKIVGHRDKLLWRLREPEKVGEGRLHNVAKKIDRRANLEIQKQLIKDCRETLTRALLSKYPDREFPKRILSQRYFVLLKGVLQLEGRARELGIDLLLRCDRDAKNALPLERENAAFLDRLEKRGICTAPWLKASTPKLVTNEKGERFFIAFATDPLEVMLMGFHFKTCLSPSDFNFYSAITNTFDINKQVLYCKRPNGKVVGRCLFALTSDGRIQTYARYFHDAQLDFSRVVDEFAIELARAMGTSLTHRCDIKPLVANKWYDDGATRGGLELLANWHDDSDLIKLIRRSTTTTFIDELARLIGSAATIRNNLQLLVEILKAKERDDLVVCLANEFGCDTNTIIRDRLHLAIQVLQYDRAASTRILESIDPRQLVRYLANHGSKVDCESKLLDLLIAFDVDTAKRYLVRTRARGIRNDKQEHSGARREAWAKIHERLGHRHRMSAASAIV